MFDYIQDILDRDGIFKLEEYFSKFNKVTRVSGEVHFTSVIGKILNASIPNLSQDFANEVDAEHYAVSSTTVKGKLLYLIEPILFLLGLRRT
jgi:hypothetical protein